METPDWPTCKERGCIGAPLWPRRDGRCWNHASPQDVEAALKVLGEHGKLDARGVQVTTDLLGIFLQAAPKDALGLTILSDARFDRARFQSDAEFYGVALRGSTSFAKAIFEGEAWFSFTDFDGGVDFADATFQANAWFSSVVFKGAAEFAGASFQADAAFDGAEFRFDGSFPAVTFGRDARFVGATFQVDAWFMGATFGGGGSFDAAGFQRDASFEAAEFQRGTSFLGATFEGTAEFGLAVFQGNAWFDAVTFQKARQLGPMLVHKCLLLDQAVFHERAQIEVAAAAVCCQRTRFLAGVQLRVRWAQVVLDDADLAAPSLLTGVPPFPNLHEGRWARALKRLLRATGVRAGRPRLLSVRRADVAGLTAARVDLRACRFAGAHHLDQFRVEGTDFAPTPRGWRWTTRQTIAEEHHWRAQHRHPQGRSRQGTAAEKLPALAARGARGRSGWHRAAQQAPAWLKAEAPAPLQIAALYRALRKGREDSKDEPGAADFYYGEMEMRRAAKRAQIRRERRREYRGTAVTAATEYTILWLYWLVCGYGLRAWRALAALAVVVGIAGVGLSRVGFHHPHPSQLVSWLYALQATISLEGKARQLTGQLTLPGELLRVALRFTGPVLLGLAALSVRSRVKR
jgi:Pentapeptide repeats (9 copies)